MTAERPASVRAHLSNTAFGVTKIAPVNAMAQPHPSLFINCSQFNSSHLPLIALMCWVVRKKEQVFLAILYYLTWRPL